MVQQLGKRNKDRKQKKACVDSNQNRVDRSKTKSRTGNNAGLWENRFSKCLSQGKIFNFVRESCSLSPLLLSLCGRGSASEGKGKFPFIQKNSITLEIPLWRMVAHIHAGASLRPLSLKMNIRFSVLFSSMTTSFNTSLFQGMYQYFGQYMCGQGYRG